ncbi:hypothetical protein [Shewanella fodinae]|jgi:hypothetical protein|uniref:Uncharacterized protein n=1 Tax=Shewanella fodinae TaxID=552357 RepID=A0A4R2F2G4_9GAMM|nr:hypothetical protein [Shewanella fodinae]TCN77703.1 hypothetical protein EDC91_1444 [Shewanella fodinae]
MKEACYRLMVDTLERQLAEERLYLRSLHNLLKAEQSDVTLGGTIHYRKKIAIKIRAWEESHPLDENSLELKYAEEPQESPEPTHPLDGEVY